ncbi:MAG: hypothetical protein K8S54_05930 [Spirochaetia bacterium]|nr:hypothetical protein [Spirochaetia bacterium]
MSAERLVQMHDLSSQFEKKLLEIERLLKEPESLVAELASSAGEMHKLLPPRGFARERALRLTRNSMGLHEIFANFRRDCGIMQKQLAKIRRDAEAVFLPPAPPPLPDEEPGAETGMESEMSPLYRNADYTLLRLGTMRFCIFDKPTEVRRNVAVHRRGEDFARMDFFPGDESIAFFSPHRDELNVAIFEGNNDELHAIWFEELMPPIIARENRVQVGSPGVSHPLVRGKFRFKGMDYYILRFKGSREIKSEPSERNLARA